MKNVAIIGTTGSIGKAFLEYYVSDNTTEKVYSISRSKNNVEDKKIVNLDLNLTNKNDYAKLSSFIPKNSLDKVIIASGILHDDDLQPEKTISSLDLDNFQKIFSVNAFAPALLLKFFFPLIRRNENALIGILSARVGSISDNKIGGWHSYRASKSALNMIIKNFSIEIGRKYKKSIIVGLHPGTVDSKLSKPFQKNVPSEKLFTGEYSASKIIKVLEDLNIEDTGKCFDFNALEIYP